MAEWHALAKLRILTEHLLTIMEEVTKELGHILRQFRQLTCSTFQTFELPWEADARVRRRKETQVVMSATESRATSGLLASPPLILSATTENPDKTNQNTSSPDHLAESTGRLLKSLKS